MDVSKYIACAVARENAEQDMINARFASMDAENAAMEAAAPPEDWAPPTEQEIEAAGTGITAALAALHRQRGNAARRSSSTTRGMLIALEDHRNREAAAFHAWLARQEHPPIIPLGVLAQAWRPRPWNPLGAVVRESVVFGTPAAIAGNCATCAAGHLTSDAQRTGALTGKASLPEKKRPDAVDAMAVVIASRHPESIILTSEPDDLTAYRDALDEGAGLPLILPVDSVGLFARGETKALR
ncbi:hypothetical protein [Streptomyces sp. UG1]|uniref:hypothetical protein n=1 Tax=Streptomyces sp. UG1 TaxID=3417652 RepID=UPI003CF42450